MPKKTIELPKSGPGSRPGMARIYGWRLGQRGDFVSVAARHGFNIPTAEPPGTEPTWPSRVSAATERPHWPATS